MSIAAQPGQKKGNLKWLWWLLGVGGLVVLCVLAVLVIFLLGNRQPLSAWETPTSTSVPTVTHAAPTEVHTEPTTYPTLDSFWPLDGTLSMPAGFNERAYPLEGRGDIHLQDVLPGCNGVINGYVRHALNLRFSWWGSSAHMLSFFFVAEDPFQDATLVVLTPDGQWFCDDNSAATGGSDLNPGVFFDYAPDGDYAIWVGSVLPEEVIPGELMIVESNRVP